ncbi:chorismate-binding protein [Xenorhabdus bovienii]|uniref:anthranilate synthase n=1 Tax=Xenorhabdus bovienii TaxID=40576 RepID=A0AAJ1JDF2_XENBV|nr:anthranilate synthase family protein [Xenorhabdus bovienii]MDE1479728.1 chorismate-binding protein [Xenorhabdus bovienii]MDE1491155.1 chorismate-binding protein [Xenorhabdus bovienii]MDE9511547.1 chorismate-binding protein [Xenorhabdus bovienii]MDE9523176.1 chorismate-binding protein [Xenorhabdus bovienii]
MNNLLSSILSFPEQPFALLYRPTFNSEVVEIFQLRLEKAHTIEHAVSSDSLNREKLLLLPFRQVIERGYSAVDDGMPILSLPVIARQQVSVSSLIEQLPERPLSVNNVHFNLDDEQFCHRVTHLIENEIGQGAGSNFVLHRKLRATISEYEPAHLLSLYRRLLKTESSAYWVFLINTGEQAFIGVSPELHASLHDGEVSMNPISGTYPYPAAGPTVESLLTFLSCQKETNELFMVVDEELKVMSQLCEKGAQVSELKLKQLSHVVHTEYVLRGKSHAGIADILRETFPAPTVIGSPIQSACDVITRYEPEGRRYYSGVVALVDNSSNQISLDSAIAIRTAEITPHGHVEIGVGATIVRDSNPVNEANETRSKVQSLYSAMLQETNLPLNVNVPKDKVENLSDIPAVHDALINRSSRVSHFWLTAPDERMRCLPHFEGKRVLILDGNDSFTSMFKTLFVSLGAIASVEKVHSDVDFKFYDLVVAGPGPGNPLDENDMRVKAMRSVIKRMIAAEHPFFAVCLSHQILSTLLGLPIVRLSPPNQGIQKVIWLGNRQERVGFYNTFCVKADEQTVSKLHKEGVTFYFDDDQQVHAIRSAKFSSVQFHLESFLTIDGPEILDRFVKPLLQTQCSGNREKCITV